MVIFNPENSVISALGPLPGFQESLSTRLNVRRHLTVATATVVSMFLSMPTQKDAINNHFVHQADGQGN